MRNLRGAALLTSASSGRVPSFVVVFAIAGVMLLLCGAGFVVLTVLSGSGHGELEVEVVPTLTATDPWREGRQATVDGGMGPIAVEVEASILGDRSLYVRHRSVWDHRSAHGDMYRDVEFWVTFEAAGGPTVRADANVHDPDGSVRPFYGLHGTARLSSNRLPTDAAAPLLMDYWIEGDHGGSPVALSGTIEIHPADLR